MSKFILILFFILFSSVSFAAEHKQQKQTETQSIFAAAKLNDNSQKQLKHTKKHKKRRHIFKLKSETSWAWLIIGIISLVVSLVAVGAPATYIIGSVVAVVFVSAASAFLSQNFDTDFNFEMLLWTIIDIISIFGF